MSATFDRLQPGVAIGRYDDVIVEGGPDRQYLYLTVNVDADEPPGRPEFAFRFDGSTYRPEDPDEVEGYGLQRVNSDRSSPYHQERGEGWLLFALPEEGDAGDAALTVGDDEWVPDGLPRERLEAPAPPLSLDWSVPERRTYDSDGDVATATITHEFAVTNEGDHDGRFVAGLNRADFVYTVVTAVNRRIPADETISWAVTDTVRRIEESGGDDPEARYVLDWSGGERTRAVTLRPDSSSD